ncbi:MAG TPA: P22 phage major capsid protein family protein [Candidatus Wunengus sp. YC61]|uniref:P22 phage major capsid protein family protein n=1 Tax=Candidatus Wunengus sp. YC61 TaxID=3367698 RepID=UPI0040280DA6
MTFASNTLISSTVLAKESLRQLENNLGMAKVVYRDWENKFSKDGETLGIRKPNKFRATKARARTNSALSESNLTLTVATQAHVSFEWSTKQMTDTVERISERYIKPAMSALANTIEVDLYALYVDVFNQVGTAGTAPADYDVYADARRRLNEEAAPIDNRYCMVNPKGEAETMKGLKGLFLEKMINDVVIKGSIGSLAGFDFAMAQNVQVHTTGYFTTGATPLVDGASQTGTTLLSKGWGGSNDLHEGDIFTAGVYAVNPKTGQSTGELRQFVVTAQIDDTGSAIDIPIYPAIITSGALQTCDSSPADEAAITLVGTESTQYPINLAFHKDAFTLAVRPLEIPQSAAWGARESYNGLSVRIIKAYDVEEDKEVLRFDVLYGVLCQYPELACRIIG